MDWHKLQQTLYNLDPSDPKEDLKKLRAQAGGGDSAPPESPPNYITESADVEKGSMPAGVDSLSDFAALAGIRLDEKQKHADYARGNEKWPEAKPGRTEHPLKDKLVGDDIEEQDGIGSFVKDKFKQGYQNYNSPDALRRSGSDSTREPKSPNEPKEPSKQMVGGVSGQRIASTLGVEDPITFSNGYNKIKTGREPNSREKMALGDGFAKMMRMDDASLRKVMNQLISLKSESKVTPSKPKQSSLKEELYRKLNSKK